MTILKRNISLKPYNTFGIEAGAAYFAEINTLADISDLLGRSEMRDMPLLILGGGSNILLTADYAGLALKNNLKGIAIISENEDEALVKASSGEIWHELVLFALDHDLGGIENLSLIPGTVGAAPMQNIGAYGAELKDVFHSLEAVNLDTFETRVFEKEECRFGYRDSIFKHEAKGRYFISSVTICLQKKPVINTSYGAIKAVLEEKGITDPGIRDVSEAVCAIRRSKLPDPAVIGNAGSFFKNPEIPAAAFDVVKRRFPEIPGYAAGNDIKVPAGWLIEQCGWKGRRVGETGSHKDQALVLVNYGHATGNEVRALAREIQSSVEDKFGIVITPEVNII